MGFAITAVFPSLLLEYKLYPKILWTISFQKWGPYCHVKYWTISDECMRAEILGSEILLLIEYQSITFVSSQSSSGAEQWPQSPLHY